MINRSYKICSSLEVEKRCKFCDEPARLLCHTCGIMTEKISHPACMIIDANTMLSEAQIHRN